MSEKRFTLVGGKDKSNEILVKVYDNFEEEVIEKQKVVELLNEQQATIEKLEWAVDVKQKYIEQIEKEKDNLKSTLVLMEYQLKVQDRIIEELEE